MESKLFLLPSSTRIGGHLMYSRRPSVNRARASQRRPGSATAFCFTNTDYRMQNMQNPITAVSFDSYSLTTDPPPQMQNYAKVGGRLNLQRRSAPLSRYMRN